MERIRNAHPKMQQIWEHSTLAKQGRDKALNDIMRFHRGIETAMSRGMITLDISFLKGDVLMSPFGDEAVQCPT